MYEKRKLTPIKKKIHAEPRIIVTCDTATFKSTFLSIEKAPLTKANSRTEEDKEAKSRKNCSLTIYNYDKLNFKSTELTSNTNANKNNLLMKSWYCASNEK
jgi:hypothetical protein